MPSVPLDGDGEQRATPITFGPNGASVVVGAIFVVIGIVTIALQPSNPVVLVCSGLLCLLAPVLVVKGWNETLTVHADRLETTSWRRVRRTHQFEDVVEARVREGLMGAPRLTVRFRDGRRMVWDARRRNSRIVVEPIIRCIHDALIRAGVDVDSRNQTGTGPFRDWTFPPPSPTEDSATGPTSPEPPARSHRP